MNDNIPIIIYRCWLATFTALPPEAVGLIIKDLSCRILAGESIQDLPVDLKILSNKIFDEVSGELKKYAEKSEKNRQVAQERWAKNNERSTNVIRTQNERNTNAERTHGNTNTNTNTNNTNVLEKEIEKKAHRFLVPSVDEVSEYCKSRDNNVDPQAFVDFYTSKGWRVGNQPMKDWKAAVRTWEKKQDTFTPKRGAKTGADAGITYIGSATHENTQENHEDIFDLFG